MVLSVCDECGGDDRHLAWCPAAAPPPPPPIDYTEPRERNHHDMTCPTCNGTGRAPTNLLQRLDRPGATGSNHPTTSRKAGTTPRKGSQRLAVLEALTNHGPMTAHRIAGLVGRSPNQTATRLLELHEDGFVRHVYDADGQPATAETTPGNTGRVHRLTVLGESVYRQATRPADLFGGQS